MIISASQTGGFAQLDRSHYSLVEAVDIDRNWVRARGRLPPSSEVLTHAVLYQLDPAIQAVFHIHDPRLWRYALDHNFPVTGAEIEYGTVAMARAMAQLYRDGLVKQRGVLAMRGHEDGVLAFGSSLDQAGARILRLWVDARLG
jgi:ribulose-5-phosphate 4-epimerase/fuculose-1-phosphate aldolase